MTKALEALSPSDKVGLGSVIVPLVAAKGTDYVSLAPTGQAAVLKRNVRVNFTRNAVAFSTGGTYTTEDFPTPAPNGQTIGAKVVFGAKFTGTITSGNTLTVSNVVGSIAQGQTIAGPGVGAGRTIISGSGATWIVTTGANVSAIQMETAPKATFTGTISGGNTLTATDIVGTITEGQTIAGRNVGLNRTIISGAGDTWTVTAGGNVSAIKMESGIAGSFGGIGTNNFTQNPSIEGVPAADGFKPFPKQSLQLLNLLVYIDKDLYELQYAHADTIQVRLEKDSSNYYDWFFVSTSATLRAGWNMLAFRWDETDAIVGRVPAITGTVADGDTITRLRVFGLSAAGNLPFLPAEFAYYDAVPTKPLIVLTFDGQYTSHTSLAMPLLQSKGIKASFTTGTGFYWNNPTISAALKAGGMEVGQQVYQHNDYPQGGNAVYTAELKTALSQMALFGYSGQIQSMPYNDITLAQVNIAKSLGVRFLREARNASTPIVEWGFGGGNINVGTTGSDNVTRANLLKAVSAAKRYGLRVITTHELTTGGTGSNTTGSDVITFVEDLSAFIDYGIAQGVTFVTAGQLVRSIDAMLATT